MNNEQKYGIYGYNEYNAVKVDRSICAGAADTLERAIEDADDAWECDDTDNLCVVEEATGNVVYAVNGEW